MRPMRWPLARMRVAGRRSASSGARRSSVSALVVITLSGLRRSWPSTAENMSARRRLSVKLAHQALALGGAGAAAPHRLRQLAPLAVEAQEDVDLLAQDRQLQRFEEKVDRAGAVALEGAQLILRRPRSRR